MTTETQPTKVSKGTILVVEDEQLLRTLISEKLRRAGFRVYEVDNAETALQELGTTPVDAVLSDIMMPGRSGLEMLRMIRSRDFDVPVVLLTGSPSLKSAVAAVEAGAFRYLTKPMKMPALVETMEEAVRLGELARWRRRALAVTQPGGSFIGDQASIENSIEEALEGLWLAAQPIVGAKDGKVFGFELLSRSVSTQFTGVGALIEAAERMGRITSFGRRVRHLASGLDIPKRQAIFVNIHTLELDDEQLYQENNPLCHLGSRVILEVTERHSMDLVKDLAGKITRLRALGFWIAVDDMGAGYSGLNSFASLRPDIVKIDMALVRGIDSDPYRRALVRSLVTVCRDLGTLVVAEGVETEAEKATLIDLDCDFLQGFLCGTPQPLPLRSQAGKS